MFLNGLPCVSLETDNELLTNGVPKKNDKNNVKGKKRKKCIRDKTAPRPPHSGKSQLNCSMQYYDSFYLLHFFRVHSFSK